MTCGEQGKQVRETLRQRRCDRSDSVGNAQFLQLFSTIAKKLSGASVSRYSAEQNDLVSFCEREAGVGSRERNEQGAKHYVGDVSNSAIVNNNCVEFGRSGKRQAAFTMAEILLSLTIIGVVAAITLPSLTGNINERTWNTQRKALYARMSQAISLMPALNGYGTLTEDEDKNVTADNAAETFITAGLSKVLKINNICDNAHLPDCGIPTSFTDMLGSKKALPKTLYELNSHFSQATLNNDTQYTYSTIDTKAVAFETQNGESIIAYYNQSCRAEFLSEKVTGSQNIFGFPQSTMCVNFIYDLNGTKGPNTAGKDIGFITVFNATDYSVVAPMPSKTANAGNNGYYSWFEATKVCNNEDTNSRIPNIDELSAMQINMNIINFESVDTWSGTVYNKERAMNVDAFGAINSSGKEAGAARVRCIQR